MKILQVVYYLFFIVTIALVSCNTEKKEQVVEIRKPLIQKSNDIVFGKDSASNIIFLFASYNCKYCRYLFLNTFPELREKYLDKGLIKIVVKWIDFGENEESLYALQAASCIYQFGVYDKFHELLLTNPSVIVSEDFQYLVDDIMAENSDIAECILSNKDYTYIKENVREFRKNNLKGTPCFVINKKVYSGYRSFKELDKILKKEFNFK